LLACTETRASAGVIVFARAPLAGRVKTRLAARLGAAGAASLHRRLIRAALDAASASRCGPVELHATASHAWLRAVSRHGKITLRLQQGRDLGERMARATRAALRRHRRVVLIGSDCPELGPREIARAARWLAGGTDAVLAPARDGGYALIALRRPAEFLFRGMPWGSERVCGETVARLARAGWRTRALGAVSDIDRPEDLARLRWLRYSSAARRHFLKLRAR
jgi:rSAM/selenodomain-associated transferase 1